MNRKLLLAGFALGAIVLGVLAGMILARTTSAPGATATAAPESGSRSLVSPSAPGPAPMAQFGQSGQPSVPGMPAAGPLAQSERTKALAAIQTRLNAMTSSGKPIDPKELDGVLADLARTQGNNVGGVDVAALRDNLARAQQIQTLANQIQAEAKQAKPDMQQIQSAMAQIQKLQAGMHTNVTLQPATH